MNSFPIAWNTRYVEPGTPWPDEPSEYIDPGWYVIGHDGYSVVPIDETDTAAMALIHVEHATDSDGNDITETLARQIADAMSTHPHSMSG